MKVKDKEWYCVLVMLPVVAEGRDAEINMLPQENTWNGVSFAVHDAGG